MIRSVILLFCLFISCWHNTAQAENLPLDQFGTLPILHEGRLKPMDSFARIQWKRLSGENADKNAIAWLAETVFDPARSVQRPIFHIKNEGLKTQLGLTEEKEYYSYLDLIDAIARTKETALKLAAIETKFLSQQQIDFLMLHDNVYVYEQMLRALSAILPLNVAAPKEYSDKKNPSYLDLQKFAVLIQQKGGDLADKMGLVRMGGVGNELFRIIPPQWQSDGKTWHSPWVVINEGKGGPLSAAYLEQWKIMALSYRDNNAETFIEASQKAHTLLDQNSVKLKAERLYSQINPFFWAKIGYVLTFIFSIFWLATGHHSLWRPAMVTYLGGKVFHILGLGMRIFILERPPVASLYESLLFVSLICVIIAFMIEWKQRKGVAITLGSISGFVLLWLSLTFTQDGETKDVLVAVLNTNFWLGTHVLMISIGYAFCVLSGLYAHFMLWMDKVKGPESRLLFVGLLMSLFFTAIGTALGGIWADQSWGRFWGWDPKENGALLIVLWLIWIIHGRLSGHITKHRLNAASAALLIIIALSWFGTNLLGVGLHSYGFTTGLTAGLFAFCTLNLAVILGFWYRTHILEKRKQQT